jgi:hypothetical protein
MDKLYRLGFTKSYFLLFSIMDSPAGLVANERAGQTQLKETLWLYVNRKQILILLCSFDRIPLTIELYITQGQNIKTQHADAATLSSPPTILFEHRCED